MDKQFEYINSVLEVEALESAADGVYLNEDQLSAIDTLIREGEEHAAKLVDAAKSEDTLNSALTAEQQAREKAETDLTSKEDELKNVVAEKETLQAINETLIAGLGEIHESIAKAETPEDKVKAIRAIIAAKPGVKPAGVQSEKDPATSKTNDGVDWETLNSLPHMQEQQ